MFLVQFLLNTAQPQPLDRFKQTLYQEFQASVKLCTLKLEFENFAQERPKIQITNFLINWSSLVCVSVN